MSNTTPPRTEGGPTMSSYSPVVSHRRSGARGSTSAQQQQEQLLAGANSGNRNAGGGPTEVNLRESMAQVTQSMRGRLGGDEAPAPQSVAATAPPQGSSTGGSNRGGFGTLDPVATAILKKAEREAAFLQDFQPYLREGSHTSAGQYLIINILSNWGDAAYVGLGGITVFDGQGCKVPLTLSQLTYLAPEEPEAGVGTGEPLTMSVANFFQTTDPRQRLESLLDTSAAGIGSKGDETRMWLTEYAGIGSHHIICVELPAGTCGVSAVVLQNYKKGRVHSLRGVRHVEMTLDDQLLFRGETRCGQMEPILLCDNNEVLRNVAGVLFPSHGATSVQGERPHQHHGLQSSTTATTNFQPLSLESQAGASVLDQQGTFPCSGVEIDVLTTWCHPPRALGLQALRLYNEKRQLIDTFEASVVIVNDEEEIEAIPVETKTLLQGDTNPATGLPKGPAIFVPLYCPMPPTAAEIEAERAKSGALRHHSDEPDMPALKLAKIRIEFPQGVDHRLSTIEVVNAKTVETDPEEGGGGHVETRFVDHFGLKEVKVSLMTRSELSPSVVITPSEGMTIRKANPTSGGTTTVAGSSAMVSRTCNKAQCFDISNLTDLDLAAQAGGGGDVMTQSVMLSAAIKTKVAIRRTRLSQVSQTDAAAWQLEHHRYQTPILPLVYVVTITLQFNPAGTVPDENTLGGWSFGLFDEEWEAIPTAAAGCSTSGTGGEMGEHGNTSAGVNRLEKWSVTADGNPFTATTSVVMATPAALSMVSLQHDASKGGGGGFAPVLEGMQIHGDDELLYIRERADENDDLGQWVASCHGSSRGTRGNERGVVFFSPEVPANRLPSNLST